jgi:SWIM zinc finger
MGSQFGKKTYTCREWQLNDIPCVHAAAFITSIRNTKWEDFVDSYFTLERFKTSYAGEIVAMPSKDEWTESNLGYKMLPPIIRRPPGRSRKSRIRV